MPAEIERKFLVGAQASELPPGEEVAVEQGYLAIDGETEVRLRRKGEELLLTAKRGRGESREEVEVPLPAEAFEALWPLTEGRRVLKARRIVPLGEGDLVAEVDLFRGELEGHATVEVEFPDEPASRGFQPPAWIGRDVTGDDRYANQSLATHGLPREPDQTNRQ